MSARINAFLKLGRQQGCSDIHFAVGTPPLIRLHGELSPIKYRDLTDTEISELTKEILTPVQIEQFEAGNDLDFSYRQLQLTDGVAIEALAGALPALDVLVNNAGQTLPGGRNEYEPEVFEEAVAINLFGAYRMAVACREISLDPSRFPIPALPGRRSWEGMPWAVSFPCSSW